MPESQMQAILAADVAADGTGGQGDPVRVRRIAREVAATRGGRIFDAPGGSVFALYDNALDAVGAAIAVQARLGEKELPGPPLRIGVHLGEVLFQEGRPFGETLIVGSLLEGLAEPGGILVSAEVREAAASLLTATFEECGLRAFAQTPRRVATFRVRTAESSSAPAASPGLALDETLLDLPPGVAQRAQPLPPQDDGAGNAVREAALSSARAFDATSLRTAESYSAPAASRGPALDETLLELPPGVARQAPPLPGQDDGAGTGGPQTGVAPQSAAVMTARAPAPEAARLDQTILALPEGGARAPAASALPPDPWRDPLTRALAARIGPIAPVIVKREAAAAVTLAELIERLAGAIPSPRERAEFHAEAAKLLPRSKS